MSTSWKEANGERPIPAASMKPGVSQGDQTNVPVNYVEFFPETGDEGFASLFPELMGMPINHSFLPAPGTSQLSLAIPENMGSTLQTCTGSHNDTAGQAVLPSLQVNVSGMGQQPGRLLWSSGSGTESTIPSLQTTPLNTVLETLGHDAGEGLQGVRSLVQDQLRQIYVLQTQIHRYHQRCVYYREKANTYKALYTQQQSLAEQTMASLVLASGEDELTPTALWSPPSNIGQCINTNIFIATHCQGWSVDQLYDSPCQRLIFGEILTVEKREAKGLVPGLGRKAVGVELLLNFQESPLSSSQAHSLELPGSNLRNSQGIGAQSNAVIMSSASAPVYVRRAPHCTKCHLPRKDHDLKECLEIQLAQYQSLAEAARLSLSTASNLNDLRAGQIASAPFLAPQASSSNARRRLSGQVRRRRPAVAFGSLTRKGRAGRSRKAPLSVSEVEDTDEESTDGSSDEDKDTVQEKDILQSTTKPPTNSLGNRRSSCLKSVFYEIVMFTLTIISATTLAFLTNQVLVILTARAGMTTFAVDTVVYSHLRLLTALASSQMLISTVYGFPGFANA
ncbi:hypothetical protein BKA70DRAFT_1230893 [Coprinopsis sp. MPI-PUGE-AT-0042]|nr:hypothetical protein BKA70DRAFT_1230893 [Coprinopsis sp. MPI-PUGE-AT-0042]